MMHPTALNHMVISSRRSYADLLFSMEAERWACPNPSDTRSPLYAPGYPFHNPVERSSPAYLSTSSAWKRTPGESMSPRA